MNPVAQALTGWTLEEAVGSPPGGRLQDRQRGEPSDGREPHRPCPAGGRGRRPDEPQPADRQGRHGAAHRRQCRPDPQRGERMSPGSSWSSGTSPNAGGTSRRRTRPSATPRRSWPRSGAVPGPRPGPAGQDGQHRLLPGVPRVGRKARRPRSSTNSATASGTSPPCGRCWRRGPAEEIAVHDFEVEHDFPEIGPRSMRAQRPPRSRPRARTRSPHPPGHRGHHRTTGGRTPLCGTPNSGSGGCSRRPRTAS